MASIHRPTRVWRFVIVLCAATASCEVRNQDVCCASVADCAAIGIPADEVDEYSTCSGGRVCVDLHCVAPPDAGEFDSTMFDSVPAGRCTRSAPFGAPVQVPNLNSSDREISMTMTDDELVAFIASNNMAIIRLLTATRSDPEDDFSTAMTDPKLAAVAAGTGTETMPWPAADGLLLYFLRQGQLVVASRDTTDDAFDAGVPVMVDGEPLQTAFRQVSPDGNILYSVDQALNTLQAATRNAGPDDFGASTSISLVGMIDPVVSADALTAYYVPTSGDDIFQSTRSSPGVPFSAGSVIEALGSVQDDAPYFVTSDECLLYLRNSDNIWVTRRGY